MSKLSDNLRFLRAGKQLSQQKVADLLMITRVRYAKYEDGTSEPPIEILMRISKYFSVSIDLLVAVDLRKYPLEEMLNLPDNRILVPIKRWTLPVIIRLKSFLRKRRWVISTATPILNI